ncbi:MAG: family 20 glycosylhydrolase [Candidatus Neomarinimicrobiota bacterium]|nr:family 20 glycosylhydrolase [Candidatus Neomarinimicrobiota bacterium]
MKKPIVILLLLFSFVSAQKTITLHGFDANDKTSKSDNFSVVAYHVDLRVQIMPMPTLKALAKEIYTLGFNTLIMEWEATYPYKEHSIISNRYAYSREELTEFINYSEGLGLDVIPLQQSLGHAEYILMHERYAYLRADKRNLSQIDPTQLGAARDFFTELYSDILSTHQSQYVHIGGDETRILDCNRCQEKWGDDGEELGKSKLYVEYMTMIAEIVIAQGKTPLLWADMILAHPNAIADMPKNVIYIDWNYGWNFDRFGENPRTLIKKYGLKFWGASSIRSSPDDYHVTSWSKHMKNQDVYVSYARESGFEGMVLTSWSTSGEYGYEWFWPEVVEIFPLRQVYPHAYPNDAFRMNTLGFIEAVEQEKTFKPKDFAYQYAQQRFGLTSWESEKLWNILTDESLNKKVIIGSSPLSGIKGLPDNKRVVSATLAKVRELQSALTKIMPKKNLEEFDHYRLQIDFREYYLRFREIQYLVQSADFSEKESYEAVNRLEQLLVRSVELDNRFKKLFTGKLYDAEIDRLNQYRSKKATLLLQRLTRDR